MHVKQAKKYLEQRGRSCPLCGSPDIEVVQWISNPVKSHKEYPAMNATSGGLTLQTRGFGGSRLGSDYRVDLDSSRVTSASTSPRLSISSRRSSPEVVIRKSS